MKIIFFGTKEWEQEYVKRKCSELGITADVVFQPHILSKDTLPVQLDAEAICVFVDSKLDREVLDAFPNLKFIATRSTGFDHIDLEAARERGIVVSTVPSYGENTVAEYAFALLLSLSRKIYQAVDQIRETGSFNFDALQGFDLKGKTLGVVGTGRIGRHAIKIAKGFDMNVVGFDVFPNQELAQELGFTYLPLPELLAQSDAITIHVPYLPETHHLLNHETLATMKPGALLINTSRGAVVDTKALLEALTSGRVGGAGLDVLEEEVVIKDELQFVLRGDQSEHDLRTALANHALIDLPNVIVTPHNAFNTREALERIWDTTFENIAGFTHDSPKNVVSAK